MMSYGGVTTSSGLLQRILILLMLVFVAATYVGRCYWGPQVYVRHPPVSALFVPPPNSVLYLSFSPLQRDFPRAEPPRVRMDSSPFPSVRVSSFCPEVGPLTCPCRSLQQVVAAPPFTLFRIVLAGRQWQCDGLARGSKLKLKVDHKHMIVIVRLSSTIVSRLTMETRAER